jgi:hypothetical protein
MLILGAMPAVTYATFDTETAQALSQPLDFAVNVQ